MRRIVLVLALAGCDAPFVEIQDASNSDTAVTDSASTAVEVGLPDAHKILTDGRVCDGHDEDTDGIPEPCDVCPNMRDKDQVVRADGIGTVCAPATITAPLSRMLFDPLIDLTPWVTGGGVGRFRKEDGAPDDFVGGQSVGGRTGFAVRTNTFPTDKGLLILAALTPSGGVGLDKTGVLLRGDGSAEQFVGCYATNVGNSRLGIVQTDTVNRCLPSQCPLTSVTEKLVPPHFDWKHQVLRVEAHDQMGGGGTITCELLDAYLKPVPNADEFTVTATIDAEHWGAPGDSSRSRVGFFVQNAVSSFQSLDVLEFQ